MHTGNRGGAIVVLVRRSNSANGHREQFITDNESEYDHMNMSSYLQEHKHTHETRTNAMPSSGTEITGRESEQVKSAKMQPSKQFNAISECIL